ncbi:MAG: TetR/AcrR family transcriptional regulator [Piscinibacter sp.]|nr:TetR/AcrR family transcriptional regulator [Piscinibacter sp.]
MDSSTHTPARTSRGAATRSRIVDAAAGLMYTRGVAGTSLDEVLATCRASKSQLYHYFADKDALVLAVIQRQTECVLTTHEALLRKIDSPSGLQRWRDAVVAMTRETQCAGGCPLGSLASALAESQAPRELLADGFARWESYFVACFQAVRSRANRRSSAELADLATVLLTALQGGLLLAQTTRSTRPLELALDAAIAHVTAQLK